jgi:hypothetical protein
MDVIVIMKHQPDSMNSTPTFAAVAAHVPAAMKWIQDEVDEKHNNGHRYAQGKDAAWWINAGYFELKMMPVHERRPV